MRGWWLALLLVACRHDARPATTPRGAPSEASSAGGRAGDDGGNDGGDDGGNGGGGGGSSSGGGRGSGGGGGGGGEGRQVVTSTEIEFLDPIRFLPGSASLDPRSTRILDALAATLVANETLQLVEVQAFALDALAQFRPQIAAERAQLVVDQLVARGVARGRLTPTGVARAPSGQLTGRGDVVQFLILRRGS